MMMAAQEKRKEYCDILGVDEGASKEEIKKAYKKLAIRCHPDKNQLNPEATKEFQRISEAYTGLCQGDDYCEDDDDFDGGGFSVFELLQMFFVRSQLFIRPTWFSRFKEADDQSVDSENPCNSAQRNFWNCSAQPTRNEDWQTPGNTRSSSSAGRGNSGKNKDRRRNNRKNASSSHNLPKDPLPTFSKSGSSATGVNANDCPGDKDNTARDVDSVSEKPINEELTSESAAKNQSDGDKKKSKTGDVDSNCSGIGSKVNTEAANSDPYAERRGSDSSVNGSSQSCHDRKPSKKKLQAEQRKREKECAEIHKKVVEKNQKEEEKRKKKEEKEKAKLAAQSIACENPQTARAAERINSNLSVPGLEESSLDQRVNEDVETDAVHDQEEEFLDPETFSSNDRIADGSECNPESIETLSTEGINDGGKGSSEFLKDLGSEKDLHYKEDHGRRIHTEHTTYSRTFYSNSANRNYSKGRNRNAIRNSDNMSSKNVTEKFKTENTRSEPDGFSLRDQYSSNSFRNEQDGVSCGPPGTNPSESHGTNPSGSQINDHVCTDNAFKSRGRPSFVRRGHVYRPGVPNPHSEVGLDSADPAFVEETAPTVGNRQNYQNHRNANTFGGNRGSRGGGGAGQIGGKQRYNQYYGESRNEVGDSGFDIVGNPPNTSDRYVSNKEHSKYAGPEAGDRCGNFPKEPFHSEAARPYMGQNPPDQFRKYRGGQGRNRGFGRGRISQNDTFMRNTGRRPYDQEFGKKDYEFHNKTASIAHGGGDGDAFNGKTMEFHRSKAAFGDKNHAAANLYASVPPHKQQSSKEFVASESKVGEPVQCTFGGTSPDAPPKNVWQDRKEFYEGALPKSREEEDEMLEAALKLSRFDASEELREPTAEISSVDHLPPSQISQDDDQVADTPPFHTERLHSWADEMEEVVNRGGMDFNVSSSMSFQSTQGSESLQSCDLLSSERMTHENIQPLPVVVPFGLKSSCIYPAAVVSSAALDTPQKTAAFVDDADDCVRSSSLVPDVLKSDESCRISENLGNIRICETPEADKFSFKMDENNFDRLQDKAPATKTEHSILDDVDECGRGGVVRDQSLPELNADDLVNPQPLGSHNKYLEIGENVGDSAENNCDTTDNDPANPCPNFAPPAGYYPPVMGVYPPFYPPYHGSFPFYPCPSFWPYMFPGLPMMPTASPQPISCPPHSHSADQCLNEVPPSVPSDLPIADLHQQGHLSQPPLFPSMFPALPLGYNPHGPQMAAFAPPHMPPFITMHIPHPHCHTAHGETIDSFLENQPVKSSADEEM